MRVRLTICIRVNPSTILSAKKIFQRSLTVLNGRIIQGGEKLINKIQLIKKYTYVLWQKVKAVRRTTIKSCKDQIEIMTRKKIKQQINQQKSSQGAPQ